MAIQESEYDEFSAPVPGQSLTDEPYFLKKILKILL